MVLKRFGFALLLSLVFVVSVLLHAPAQQLARGLPPTVGVKAWGGTVTQGQFDGAYQQQPIFLSWDWRLPALLAGRIEAQSQVIGTVNGQLHLRLSPLSWQASLQRFSLKPGNWMVLPPGTQMPAWQSSEVVLKRASSGEWLEAKGAMTTPGGPSRLVLQGQVQEFTMPKAVMRFTVENGGLLADLRQSEDNAPLARLTLSADNRLEWRVRDRLLRLSPKYVSTNEPDVEVLTVSEPL